MKKGDLSILAEKWQSAIVSRDRVEDFSGGLITQKYIANLDSAGKGPRGRFKIGRKTVYPVDLFIEWLEKRVS